MDQFFTSTKKTITKPGELIKCPFCEARCSTADLVIKHSVNAHPKKPVLAALEAMGIST